MRGCARLHGAGGPVGLVIEEPEPQLISEGLVPVGREERRPGYRLDEVVLHRVGEGVDELLLRRLVVDTGG